MRAPRQPRQLLSALATLFSAAPLHRKIAAALFILVAVFVLWQEPGKNGEVHGRVTQVADGDTLTVVDGAGQAHKIRLAFIDAPERAQAGGNAAQGVLKAWVSGREVRVLVLEQDQYGRSVGQVWLDGRDINLALVDSGQAWHYQQYAKDKQAAADYTRYQMAEVQARQARIGLWRHQAEPPWRWRARQRAANQAGG